MWRCMVNGAGDGLVVTPAWSIKARLASGQIQFATQQRTFGIGKSGYNVTELGPAGNHCEVGKGN